MKKILIFFPFEMGENAFSGGIPKVFLANIEAAQKLGLFVFAFLPENNASLKRFIEQKFNGSIRIISTNISSISLFFDVKGVLRYYLILKNIFFFLIGYLKIYFKIRKLNLDIIHFHEHVCFPYFILKSKCKILHLHSYRFTKHAFLLKIISKLSNKFIDIILSPTASIKNEISRYYSGKIVLLKTPYFEITKNHDKIVIEKNNTLNKIKFVYVGRINRIKRIDHFILAISELSDIDKNSIEFHIVGTYNTIGDKEYLDELKMLVRAKHLNDLIFFRGYIADVEEIIKNFDVGVILSESEAIPMVGIELFKYGKPIIAYDVPGINDFCITSVNSILIKDNDITNLRVSILQILHCQDLLVALSKNAASSFNQFSFDSFLESLNNIYSLKL